jgi:hypothetical protein
VKGLISDLKEKGQEDAEYAEALFSGPMISDIGEISMFVIPHLDFEDTACFKTDSWLSTYRNFVLKMAEIAEKKMMVGGIFAVGVKDVRVSIDQKKLRLIPLSVLVCQDLNERSKLRMKEYVGCVRGGLVRENKTSDHDKLRQQLQADLTKWEIEKISEQNSNYQRHVLPIVHANYLLFQKSAR